MAWTDLTFSFGAVLTSSQMTQLDDNFDALASGALGAPEIVEAALAAAVSGQLVTNGDSHNHLGGDGGAIAFSSLSGTIGSSQIPTGLITATHLAADSVASSEIAANAVGNSELASGAVKQANIAVTQQTSSVTASTSILYTGGLYTFMWGVATSLGNWTIVPYGAGASTSGIKLNKVSGTETCYYKSAFVTASQPYDMGDGEIPEFYFLRIDNTTGNIVGIDACVAPPWIYNGPTKTVADRYGKDGRQYINKFVLPDHIKTPLPDNAPMAAKIARMQDIAGFNKNPVIEEVELTPIMKNADMDLIQSPFGRTDSAMNSGYSIVMLDPMSSVVEELSLLRQGGKGQDTTQLILDGYIAVGNIPLPRKGPKGLMIVSADWKLTA